MTPGGGGSYCVTPTSKGSEVIPVMASDGIHDTDRTDDSNRMSSAYEGNGRGSMVPPGQLAVVLAPDGRRASTLAGDGPLEAE
jgi:hypothetical protein